MKDAGIHQMGEPEGAGLLCQASPPHRILVVDDEPLVRNLNTRMLIDSGYHVDAVEDGAVAWDALQVNRYDLLVTDNNMPKMSGVELITKLHAARIVLPVIMATGGSPHQEFIRQPWLQPAATLLKPYTVAEFLGTVRSVLCGTVLITMLQLCLLTFL
jgi:DNA-binding response OmpR family regulator